MPTGTVEVRDEERDRCRTGRFAVRPAALDWAAEHARSVGAVLRAVHVLDWPYGLSSAGFPAPANFMELGREEIEDSYRRAITAVFEAVSPASIGLCSSQAGIPARSWFSSPGCAPAGRGHPGARWPGPTADGVGEPPLPEPRRLPGRGCAGSGCWPPPRGF